MIGARMHVLLVDDHPIFRKGLEFLLLDLRPGLTLSHCSQRQELEACLAGARPQTYDLVLLDLRMPGFEALQALEYVRTVAPETPVVVLSGEEDAGTVHACVDLGACSFVSKSAPPVHLLQALEQVLGGGVHLPASSLGSGDAAWRSRTAADQVGGLVLTGRQVEVLRRVVQGKTNKMIARELGISDGTVKTHLTNVMALFEVGTRTQLVFELARRGLSIDALGEPETSAY